jgi:hypothetical protein
MEIYHDCILRRYIFAVSINEKVTNLNLMLLTAELPHPCAIFRQCWHCKLVY